MPFQESLHSFHSSKRVLSWGRKNHFPNLKWNLRTRNCIQPFTETPSHDHHLNQSFLIILTSTLIPQIIKIHFVVMKWGGGGCCLKGENCHWEDDINCYLLVWVRCWDHLPPTQNKIKRRRSDDDEEEDKEEGGRGRKFQRVVGSWDGTDTGFLLFLQIHIAYKPLWIEIKLPLESLWKFWFRFSHPIPIFILSSYPIMFYKMIESVIKTIYNVNCKTHLIGGYPKPSLLQLHTQDTSPNLDSLHPQHPTTPFSTDMFHRCRRVHKERGSS